MSALTASLLVANCIANAKKPLPIGEQFILTAPKDIHHKLLGESVVQKLPRVPLLGSTITRVIDEIAKDIEVQLLGLMSHCGKKIQVDQTIDIDKSQQ